MSIQLSPLGLLVKAHNLQSFVIKGKKDPKQLLVFLDKHAATMPRTALRYAIEHLDKKQRTHYLGMKKAICG